ncbi:class I SAM-dependent methyltransferase [Bacillus methanolicus]|uniref:class I SAM-dependent methyltransferase n=1 Tax=Bacillus methanolicus TaxID=1471 RepID=UPI00200D2226|nr:class I SAM-dependent methyltransferase [Bacillus methanolicus]
MSLAVQDIRRQLEQAVKQGVEQYVILGAGMDTFAFRRLDLLNQVQVFEVDHSATQVFKLNRLAELEWKILTNLHFEPMDFIKESLADALKEYILYKTGPIFDDIYSIPVSKGRRIIFI